MVPVGTNYVRYPRVPSSGGPMERLSFGAKDRAVSGNPGYRATGPAPRGLTRSLVTDVAMPWIAVQLL
jgi:hypothetical protein